MLAFLVGLVAALRSAPRSAPPTRRQLLVAVSSATAAFGLRNSRAYADGLTAAPPSLAGRPGFVPEPSQQLVDPFAAARQSDPSRGSRFVDEAPPVSPEDRRKAQRAAVDQIYDTGNAARPAPKVSKFAAAPGAGSSGLDDEFSIEFDSSKPLGLKLKDLRVGFETGTTQGTSRVLVSEVVTGGQAAGTGRVQIDNLVVAVDGVNVERESAKDVTTRLAQAKLAGRPVQVTFKDALAFNERLSDLPKSREEAMAPVATKIAPATAEQAEQVLSVRRLEVPERCTRNAQSGDLVEIRYVGRLADGTVFDGMDLAERFADDSIQFVLGRQPAGQFPPSWDVGLQGMCVEERREIDVPPVLGFGPKGLVKKGVQLVPPNARIIYDVECVAINANAQH